MKNLASVYFYQQRYADAESVMPCVAARREGPRARFRATGIALDLFGAAYYKDRKFAEAEPLLTRSLAIHEKSDPPNAHSTAVTLRLLALVYRGTDRAKRQPTPSSARMNLNPAHETAPADH